MPQMAPMNWTLMFFIFVSLFILTLSLIYFSKNTTSISASKKITPHDINNFLIWKW